MTANRRSTTETASGQLPQLAGASARSAMRRPVLRRPPWYARKRVLFPLVFLLTMGATLGALAWHIPVVNPFTGEKENIGQQMTRVTENLLNPRYSLHNAFHAQRQISVLLVGLDHVPERKGEEDAIRRSDSVLLATTDFSTKQIRLLSIPRDGWCEQYGDSGALSWNKMAHSYANGQLQAPDDAYAGIKNTKDAVERLLGVGVDYFVVIQFEGLAQVIDALGGLEIDVEKRMNYDDRRGNLHIHFEKGLQHMTGEQVVQYARFRHDMLGDISRMARQQQVLKLVLEKAMDPRNVTRLPVLAKLLNECVVTNLSLDQLLALAQHIDEYAPTSIQTQTLQSYGPQDPQFPDSLRGRTHGMAVQAMLPEDVLAGRDFLLNLEPPPPPEPEVPPAAEASGEAPPT